jgi:putative endonuclease
MANYEDFARQPHTHARGRSAEQAATAWLERHGYRIEARNHQTQAGEIDVVARDGDTLCFIEVKARDSDDFGSPLEAVDRRKQLRLGRSASLYLLEEPWDGPCRFDVLGLVGGEDGWRFVLIEDAFELP